MTESCLLEVLMLPTPCVPDFVLSLPLIPCLRVHSSSTVFGGHYLELRRGRIVKQLVELLLSNLTLNLKKMILTIDGASVRSLRVIIL